MSLPRLALVANNVADAVYPLRGERQVYVISSKTGDRRVTACGYAPTLWRQLGAKTIDAAFPYATASDTTADDRRRMRSAVQPWFDHPVADEP